MVDAVLECKGGHVSDRELCISSEGSWEEASRKLLAQYPTSAPSGKRMLLSIMQTGSVAVQQPDLGVGPTYPNCQPATVPVGHLQPSPSLYPHLIYQLWYSLLGKHNIGTLYRGLATSTVEKLPTKPKALGSISGTTEKEPLLGQT